MIKKKLLLLIYILSLVPTSKAIAIPWFEVVTCISLTSLFLSDKKRHNSMEEQFEKNNAQLKKLNARINVHQGVLAQHKEQIITTQITQKIMRDQLLYSHHAPSCDTSSFVSESENESVSDVQQTPQPLPHNLQEGLRCTQ